MAISLYDVSVSNYLQTLGAMSGFLDKAARYCEEMKVSPEEMVETRIFPDMQPLRFQIQQVRFHSLGAIGVLKSGVLEFPSRRLSENYAELQALVADACAELRKITPEEVNARSGVHVEFQDGENKRIFTAEGFVLSFSLPNFYFHATTAYDILRMKGVPLGKADYMGTLRLES